MDLSIDLSSLADEIVSKPERSRELLYCNIVDFYELTRAQQWDLQVYCAELGWER